MIDTSSGQKVVTVEACSTYAQLQVLQGSAGGGGGGEGAIPPGSV